MWYMSQDGLRTWAKQIESALCLINGKAVTDDAELLSGPVSLGFFVVVVLIIPSSSFLAASLTPCTQSLLVGNK